MIEKLQYYHGAAIVSLLEKENYYVRKMPFGYVVNGDVFVFLKYRTNSRTPWTFIIDQEDINRCVKASQEYREVIIGLICGGDGVCGMKWGEVKAVIDLNPGWITLRRKHNESYGVSGQIACLKGKIPVSRWSTIISDLI